MVGGLIGFDEVVRDTLFAFPYVHGGTLSNLVLVVLATVGVYFYGARGVPGRFLGFLVLLSSVVYIVSSQARKMRLVLNLPFGLFGALVVHTMCERRGWAFTVFVVAYSLFYVLVSVGNLVW